MDPSSEVQAMQQAERQRWLTVAEANTLLDQWKTSKAAIDRLAEVFEADPDNETAALGFMVATSLVIDGLMRAARRSTMKMAELRGFENEHL